MTCRPLLLLGLVSLSAAGCAVPVPSTTTQSAGPPRELTIPVDAGGAQYRYELHEIKNGTYIGTALLDRKTGRIWTLGSESKNGHVTDVMFSEVVVYPKPEGP